MNEGADELVAFIGRLDMRQTCQRGSTDAIGDEKASGVRGVDLKFDPGLHEGMMSLRSQRVLPLGQPLGRRVKREKQLRKKDHFKA